MAVTSTFTTDPSRPDPRGRCGSVAVTGPGAGCGHWYVRECAAGEVWSLADAGYGGGEVAAGAVGGRWGRPVGRTRVDSGDGVEAVAAAALVASTIANSQIVMDPEDGPEEPLPELPASIRAMARKALHRVLQEGSELTTGWVDSADADRWRQELQQILDALDAHADHLR
ncbi:DUF4259 domain-containing protein [Streptomyces sp. NPDC088789]|uniref:DUF4259 domain-containing protein n=1 Tax=Streptomyces sp. NPDC088789 TaxID=3365899 RepID=UPI0037FE3272